MNLKAFLVSQKMFHEFQEKAVTHHASDAARAAGLPLDQIVKSLVFVDQDGTPLMAVIRADKEVSRHKLQDCAGAKSINLASDRIAESVTGFPTGGIPPVGHRKKLPVFVDNSVASSEHVWCGGGTRSKLVKLKSQEIIVTNQANVCDLAIE
jgi:Cys-tRNA(Pro) deacylase